jgi:7-cyano-7-deazaguanine synthase
MNSILSHALVVHSGGADSTICLHWALKNFEKVEAISFDYGQRHHIELEAAATICKRLGIPHKVVGIDSFKALGGNALVDAKIQIEHRAKQLPSTFVPGRNLIFMTLAAAWAWQIKAKHLVTGVCQTDYSGYPDCRADTMEALQLSLNLGMESDFTIHTPLMHLSKADSIKLAQTLPGTMESLAFSHTCYEGKTPPCGTCPSCLLRAKGFAEIGIVDPLRERLGL